MNPMITNKTAATITIGWSPPLFSEVITYTIALSTEDGDSTFQTVEESIMDNSINLTHTFRDLPPFTSFRVRLTAASSDESVEPNVCTITARTEEEGKEAG